MRPYADYLPVIGPQPNVCIAIPFLIRQNLGTPELGVLFRPRRVIWTPMPKAPVDEHRNTRSYECNVGHPARLGQDRDLNSVSQSQSSKLTA